MDAKVNFDFPSFVLEKVEEPKVEGYKIEKIIVDEIDMKTIIGYKTEVKTEKQAAAIKALVELNKLPFISVLSEWSNIYNIFAWDQKEDNNVLFVAEGSCTAESPRYKTISFSEMLELLANYQPARIPELAINSTWVDFEMADGKITEIDAGDLGWVSVEDLNGLAEYIHEFNNK